MSSFVLLPGIDAPFELPPIPGADTCPPPVASPVAVDGGRVSVHRQPSAGGVCSAHTSPPDALGKSSGG